MHTLLHTLAAVGASLAMAIMPPLTPARKPPIVKNIVLAHGAFADDTSWWKRVKLRISASRPESQCSQHSLPRCVNFDV